MLGYKILGFILSLKPVKWAIKKCLNKKEPWRVLVNEHGEYMRQWWFFNPYKVSKSQGKAGQKYGWIPFNIRIHHIMKKDKDKHLHDHPWNAIGIVFDGTYIEVRQSDDGSDIHDIYAYGDEGWDGRANKINHYNFHRITDVSEGGAWTMFITFKYKHSWGFLVDGVKIPWRKYLGLEAKEYTDD